MVHYWKTGIINKMLFLILQKLAVFILRPGKHDAFKEKA